MACKNTPHVHEASPGTRMLFLSIYLSYLLPMIPCSYWASTCSAVLPSCSAYMLRVTSGRRFAAGFLQIPPHDGHPCLKLYPSHYRADSGLAPVRTCARRAHSKGSNTPPHSRVLLPFILVDLADDIFAGDGVYGAGFGEIAVQNALGYLTQVTALTALFQIDGNGDLGIVLGSENDKGCMV